MSAGIGKKCLHIPHSTEQHFLDDSYLFVSSCVYHDTYVESKIIYWESLLSFHRVSLRVELGFQGLVASSFTAGALLAILERLLRIYCHP